jgi:hypothetical protein
VEEIEHDGYYSRTTRSRHSPPPKTTTTTGDGGGKAPGITDPPDERVLNPMTVTAPVRMPSPEPSPPKLATAPTPEPATLPVLRPLRARVQCPPDPWIPVDGGDGVRLLSSHELSPQVAYPTTLSPQS